MRYKKIRNGKRILDNIKEWRDNSIKLDLESLGTLKREYVKIMVPPYNYLQISSSRFPEPQGIIRQHLLSALLDIFDNWKISLDKLGKPYYLKIWLYNQRFAQSQVVCAIDDLIDFYEPTFHKPEEQKKIDLSSYGNLSSRMDKMTWQYALDEEHWDNTSIGEIDEYATENDFYETKRWLKKRLQKPHRKTVNPDTNSLIKEYYSFKHGTVWIGGK